MKQTTPQPTKAAPASAAYAHGQRLLASYKEHRQLGSLFGGLTVSQAVFVQSITGGNIF